MPGFTNTRAITITATFATLLGPAVACLYELGYGIFPPSLVGIGFVVALAAAGVSVGAIAIFGGARVAGLICSFANSAVFVLYGFLILFFVFGGSR